MRRNLEQLFAAVAHPFTGEQVFLVLKAPTRTASCITLAGRVVVYAAPNLDWND